MTKKAEFTVSKSSKNEDAKLGDKVILRSEDLCKKGDPICYRVDDLTNLDGKVIGTDISFKSDKKKDGGSS